MRLKDKVCIVTGAGSGFGEGIARRFAAEGARVVVNDIEPARGERVAGAIRDSGGTAELVPADVTRDADWARLVQVARAKFDRLDVVVNNAGWTHRKKAYLEVSDAEFDKVFAVNVKSVFLSARHVLPAFRSQGGGAIVNVASTGGLRPRPGLVVYNSSKAAVIMMSKAMAAEFGPDKVRVNCVNPVFSPDTALSTEFAGGALTAEVRAKYLATIPLGRFSTPLDVANACLYLASDEAALVSGVCIEVDGARCV
jgi:3-oxoacyl-[acyl-carrier protein] reductase